MKPANVTRGNLSRTGRMMAVAADHYKGKKNIPGMVKAVIQEHRSTRLSPTHLAQVLRGCIERDANKVAQALVQVRFQDPKMASAALSQAASAHAKPKALQYHASIDELYELMNVRRGGIGLRKLPPKKIDGGRIQRWEISPATPLDRYAFALVDTANLRRVKHVITRDVPLNGDAFVRIVKPGDTIEKVRDRFRDNFRREVALFEQSSECSAKKRYANLAKKIERQAEVKAEEMVRSVFWNPSERKAVNRETPYILRALMKQKYPDGVYAKDRFMFEVRNPEEANVILQRAIENTYGPIGARSIGVVNRMVLFLGVALENGYQPSQALLRMAEKFVGRYAQFSDLSYNFAVRMIAGVWVYGTDFFPPGRVVPLEI